MIGLKTALIIYAALLGAALILLHGLALSLALVVVLGFTVKTAIDYLRNRMDS